MTFSPLWRRVLWKEWVQGRAILGLSLGLLLVMLLWRDVPRVVLPAFIAQLCLLTIWAVERALDKGLAQPVGRGTFPIAFPLQLFVIYLLPLAIPPLLGALCGRIYALGAGEFAELPGLAQTLALVGGATFLLTTLLTRAFSLVPGAGAIVGVVWLFVLMNPEWFVTHQAVIIALIVGSVGAIVLWEWLARMHRVELGRMLVVLVLIGAPLFPTRVVQRVARWAMRPSIFQDYTLMSFSSPENTFTCCYQHDIEVKVGTIEIINRRSGAQQRQLFSREESGIPLTFLDESRVLVARQRRGEPRMTLQAWTFADDHWQDVMTLPLERGLLARVDKVFADPIHRYFVLVTNGQVGRGYAVWLVDTRTRRVTLSMSDIGDRNDHMGSTASPEGAAWQPTRVLLSGRMPSAAIDFTTGRGHLLGLEQIAKEER
jgi:hypothetical protein